MHQQKKLTVVGAITFLCIITPSHAATYHVRPDGDNAHAGTAATAAAAWRSVDRGQPALLLNDAKDGDTELALSKASQFPEKGTLLIGKDIRVAYTGRSAQKVTGCQGVKAAKKGSCVTCPDAPPPQAGDTVLVAPGVYTETFTEDPIWSDYPPAVVVITSGGAQGQPVVFKGMEGAAIDGRDDIMGVAIAASHVTVEGFEVRKGGVWGNHAKHITLRSCSIHGGRIGVSFHYCSALEISGNIVYDIVGAWSQHGINLDNCESSVVTHNTIVANSHAIWVNRGSGIQITRNLISWCRLGIILDEKNPPKECVIKDNNIWACGKWTWLQKEKDSGKDYYKNIDTTLTTGDTHVEPMIVQWNPTEKDFLSPHSNSPIAADGAVKAGARSPAPYPNAGHKPGENLVFNPSFESGLLGWNIGSWMPMTLDQTDWSVIEDSAAIDGHCLELRDLAKGDKAARLCVKSQFFHYTKGAPLTISFCAKAETEGALLDAGFATPSWQGKSGVGTKFKLTTEWKCYSWTTTLPPRFSDFAAALFTTSSGRVSLDAVKVEEGPEATAFSPVLEFAPDDRIGLLLEPGAPFKGQIINRTGKPFLGEMRWTIEAPFHGVVAKGAEAVESGSDPKKIAVDLMKEKPLEGYFLFRHSFCDTTGVEIDRGMCRLAVGHPARPCRNQDFFAATPPYAHLLPGPIFDRQAASLQAMGLGTLHLYLGYDRINDMISSPRFTKLLESTEAHNLQWLFTPSDANALTGKATWAPGPGNVGPEAIETKRADLGGGVCTDTQLAAWTEAVGLLATTLKGRVKYWEILNEPNTFLTGPEYAKVLEATSKTLRANDPAAHLIGGSVVNAHRHDLYKATMATAPGTFDSFSYHPYRFGLTNPESEKESHRQGILGTKQDLVAAGHKPDIFLTEEGMGSGLDETRCVGSLLGYDYPVSRVDFGEGELLQAQYLARMYATALGEGCIGYSYHTLSGLIWDTLMNPKLGFKAIHTMREFLGDAAPLGRVDVGRYHVCYLFEVKSSGNWLGALLPRQRRVVAALWSKDAEYAARRTVTLRGTPECAVTDLFGFPTSVAQEQGNTSFSLGRELVYLTFDDTSLEEIRETLTKSFIY